MDTPLITVSNLRKDFKIHDSPQDRLWEIILRNRDISSTTCCRTPSHYG